MSQRSRARRLQKATGLSYQQALAAIRAHAEEAAALARRRGWPLWRCDLALAGVEPPPEPIEVVEVPAAADDPIVAVCAQLAATTLARAVLVLDSAGGLIAHVGPVGPAAALWCTLAIPRVVGRGLAPVEPVVTDVGDGRAVYAIPLDGGRAFLSILFDETTSLGLVRLRTRQVLDELDRLLAARRRPAGAPIPPAPTGSSGNPAEAWLSVAARRKRDRS